TEDFEGPGSGWSEPDVANHAWHQIHLRAKLRHVEAVHDVYRAEQHLDRLAKRQVQVVAFDHDIVARAGIVWIQAQRVVRADVHGIGSAESAVFSWKAEAPLPLLADGLDFGRPWRHRDELGPDEQAGSQHGSDANRGPYGEPPLELLVLWFVCRLCSRLVAEAEHAIGHKQDDCGENA